MGRGYITLQSGSSAKCDYLVVGSGLSALVFAALMARSGRSVRILEAHEFPGGFGHTFPMGKAAYKFNAQFHYVWNCGEGQPVHRILQQLGLDQEVTFEQYDPDGFDHMRMPGYALDIPADNVELTRRLVDLFPRHARNIQKFISLVQEVSRGLDLVTPPVEASQLLRNVGTALTTARYRSCTLQDAFDRTGLPLPAQTLLALQWPDFLLPPRQLSFFAWVMLFTGYQRGAYIPTKNFEHVIDSLVGVIKGSGGEVLYQHEVDAIHMKNGVVDRVRAKNLVSGEYGEFTGKTIICNMDPQRAAGLIGLQHFSGRLRRKLSYEYSPSNFMAYCAVRDIDLRDYGFGRWNVFHSGHEDLNVAFDQMYNKQDYSNPSFAITTPDLITRDLSDRPPGQQIIELLTVADYNYFQQLKQNDEHAYKRRKKEILNAMLDQVDAHYIPGIRKHLAFKITGSPTTNERYCWCPQGNSYGSNMTPENIGMRRLNHESSIDNLYFCNASAGFAGFAGSFWTGARLYQVLSGCAPL